MLFFPKRRVSPLMATWPRVLAVGTLPLLPMHLYTSLLWGIPGLWYLHTVALGLALSPKQACFLQQLIAGNYSLLLPSSFGLQGPLHSKHQHGTCFGNPKCNRHIVVSPARTEYKNTCIGKGSLCNSVEPKPWSSARLTDVLLSNLVCLD